MNINLGRNHRGEPLDAEIERDVAELRSLLAGVDGPKEPHPAYWQNFVVHVRNRIDEEGGRRKRRSFSTAWASVGAAVVVTFFVISGIFTPEAPTPPSGDTIAQPTATAAKSDLAMHYQDAGSQALILSGEDMRMINAIVSENDDAIFEAMVESGDL